MIEEYIKKILEHIGENPNREGLKDTPNRIARMYNEIFKGYKKPYYHLTTFPNGKDGIKYDQIITDQGYFYSMCEHHMVSFFGSYYFGYIPDERIIGLSKIADVIDYNSSKLQVQERLTKQVVDEIEKVLKPKGIVLILRARHLCREIRDVKKHNAVMTTSEMRGVFRKESATRQEFLKLVDLSN